MLGALERSGAIAVDESTLSSCGAVFVASGFDETIRSVGAKVGEPTPSTDTPGGNVEALFSV